MIWLQQVAYYRLTAKSNTTQDWDWEGNEIGTGRERGRGWEGTRSGLGGERSGLGGVRSGLGGRGRGWGGRGRGWEVSEVGAGGGRGRAASTLSRLKRCCRRHWSRILHSSPASRTPESFLSISAAFLQCHYGNRSNRRKPGKKNRPHSV